MGMLLIACQNTYTYLCMPHTCLLSHAFKHNAHLKNLLCLFPFPLTAVFMIYNFLESFDKEAIGKIFLRIMDIKDKSTLHILRVLSVKNL